MNTNLIRKTHRGYDAIHLEDAFFNDQRVIFFGEEVTAESAQQLISQLITLEMQKPAEPILLYINSPGGSVTDGMAVIDIMNSISSPVYTCCLGTAASMAAVILAAGEKGHRTVSENSRVMIHEPLISGGLKGSATTIERTAKSILETKKMINTLLSQYTGKPIREINKATSFDNFMNAKDAVAFGLCDSISTALDFKGFNTDNRKELEEI